MSEKVYEELGERTAQFYARLWQKQKENWQSQLRAELAETQRQLLQVIALYEKVEKGQQLKQQQDKLLRMEKEYRTFCREVEERFQILLQGSESTGEFPFSFYDKQQESLREFQKRLQKLCREQATVLRENLIQYDDIQLRIEQARERHSRSFAEERDRIKEKYRQIYYRNIQENAQLVNTIDSKSKEQWQTFLKDKIFQNNRLQKELNQLQQVSGRKITEEFNRLQRSCLIRGYLPNGYVFADLEKEAEGLVLPSAWMKENVEKMTPQTAGIDVGKKTDREENRLGRLIGNESNVRRRVNLLLTRFTMTPIERTCKMVDLILEDICAEYEPDTLLQKCAVACERVCSVSMQGVCGTQQNTAWICTQLKQLPVTVTRQGIRQGGMWEILSKDS